jgi:hypothetical protein
MRLRLKTTLSLVALAVLSAVPVAATPTALRTIVVSGHSASESTDSTSLWAVTLGTKVVNQIDLATGKIIRRFALRTALPDLVHSPWYFTSSSYSSGQDLYVEAPSSGIDVMNESTGAFLGKISTAGYAIAMAGDSGHLYVLEWGSGTHPYTYTYQSIALSTNQVTGTYNDNGSNGSCGGTHQSIAVADGSLWSSPNCFQSMIQLNTTTMTLEKQWKSSQPVNAYPVSNGNQVFIGSQVPNPSLFSLTPNGPLRTIPMGKNQVGSILVAGNRLWAILYSSGTAPQTGLFSMPLTGSQTPALRWTLTAKVPTTSIYASLLPGNNHCWLTVQNGANSFTIREFN